MTFSKHLSRASTKTWIRANITKVGLELVDSCASIQSSVVPVYKFRVVAPLHDTPFQVVAEGVRPFTHLFVDLLDDRLLSFFWDCNLLYVLAGRTCRCGPGPSC